ncbi:EAL domain-containing protein [Pseudanabaena sp. UWO310]|uniref:EAL domain-containing protein n=1 Tax=Pseudanabaena sp. UWO310 TaxID=2480795 RepID=UPI001157F92D|nr:EAL domain-containing protein [Pseudanabaena sp. UWO310]TYQ27954.1 EAL domain-containing protein [Pseudanabaena sp. UWO310]
MRSLFSKFISRLVPKLLLNQRINSKRSRLLQTIWRVFPTLFATGITLLLALYSGFLPPIELFAYNSFTHWRGDRPWDERLIMISIDDESIQKLGRFPWTRDRYVQLLQKLEPAEPSVIGFDILWSEPSGNDRELAAAIERSQRVVLAMAWDKSGQPLLPVEPIGDAGAAVGHILKREDIDGIVRQMDLQVHDVPTLGVAMLQTYDLTNATVNLLPQLNQTLTINWTKRVKDIPQVSFSDVINDQVPASVFYHKIILVGATASGIDSLVTPFDRNPPASGVHLHAMVLQNLLQKNSLVVTNANDIWILALGGSLILSLLSPRKNLWIGSISAFALAGIWVITAFIAFTANYWIAIAVPMLMVLLTGFAIALQERWQVRRSLQTAKIQLDYESTHDHLTGLYNRSQFERILQSLLYQNIPSFPKRDRPHLLAILWINIARFKNINDTFGHPIGNLLIVEVSQCLRSTVPSQVAIARFGGAEFVILLERLSDEQEAIAIADEIQSKFKIPFIIAGNQIDISANIGIKFHQVNPIEDRNSSEINSPEILLRDADTAMFYAKKLGISCNQVFHISMRERVLKRLQLEKDLRKAVAISQDIQNQPHQEFLIYYQPILALSNMQIVGLEALIRWQHPERGLISPTQFIPLAEETGLIVPIGDWIMRNACLQLKSWHQKFPKAKDITISVNLSPKQLAQKDVLEKCLNILQQTQLSPEHLKIELTESSIMENPNSALTILNQMRQAGIKIYIDDFGTGYSSLAYLHKFPFDGLKIDRSFVNNIHTNTNGMGILQAIIALAKSVKAHIVAEGIESLAQLNYLQDLLSEDGDGQGFFLFRPLDVKAIEAIFQSI